MGDPMLYRLSYLQRQGGEEQYDCEAVQQRTRGKEKRDFICAMFLSPTASFSAWLEKKKPEQNQDSPSATTTTRLLTVPPSTPTQSHAVSRAQTPVLCLTWCLLPSTRTNKDFTPHL